ncbi:TetR family transcriptional regulator [Amycolatopsis sp. NPDC049252]|uniref:TetR family transcriptional regulator n=1 Tax=Amycolatopsis sp. NPDC049252 TaxID=3363933 RepID=UPI0037154F19
MVARISIPAPCRVPRRPGNRIAPASAAARRTSLQQIAEMMGVTKANVHYYFRTKIAILEAFLEPTVTF